MVRRSDHSPEQLRELIIDSARGIIAENGLLGLSAREIARKVGYSPGTLYNLFDGLDDLVLQLEARVLDALDRRLSELQEGIPQSDHLGVMAREYGRFCREHPQLWNLISQHDLPPKSTLPPWYSERIERLLGRIEVALAPHFPPGQSNAQDLRRSAHAIWAGLYGLASLSTSKKLSNGSPLSESLIDEFVDTYLAGLAVKARGH